MFCIGCKQVVFKMDRYGNRDEIVQNKVFEFASRVPSFQCFDKELFTGDLRHFKFIYKLITLKIIQPFAVPFYHIYELIWDRRRTYLLAFSQACALSWLRFSSICSWNWNYESLFFGFQVPELGSCKSAFSLCENELHFILYLNCFHYISYYGKRRYK